MCSVYPSQLLYMATHKTDVSKECVDWLQAKIISGFWENPVLLLEAVRVWHHCGGIFDAGVFLSREQFEACCENLKDALCCGTMIVHLSSTSIMNLKRVACPEQPISAVLNVEELIQKHASTVSGKVHFKCFFSYTLPNRFLLTKQAMLFCMLFCASG